MWEVPVTYKSSSNPEEVTQMWLHLEDESIQMYVYMVYELRKRFYATFFVLQTD